MRLVGRRLLMTLPTLFGVLVVAFLLLNVAPGDPVAAMVGERADSPTIARRRARRPRPLLHHPATHRPGPGGALSQDGPARAGRDAARGAVRHHRRGGVGGPAGRRARPARHAGVVSWSVVPRVLGGAAPDPRVRTGAP